MDALFVPLASAVGASVEQLKLIFCLLISYPLSSIFIRIPSSRPNLRHLFSILISFIYLVPINQSYTGFLQLLGSIVGTYVIAALVQGPRMPWIVFIFVMGHLTINHIIRAVSGRVGYDTFEITGPQMVLTMKLTAFAWNVWDGRRPSEDLDKWQLEKRVINFPSLLTFLGYAFYFPGLLVGPSLEFADYIALVDDSLFKSVKEEGRTTKPGRAIPTGRKRVAYRKMATGLAFLGPYVMFYGRFNFSWVLSPWFVSQSLIHRIAYLQLCGFFERSKYYAVWTLTEGACIVTGLGFTGFSPSGESLWEGAANVKCLSIEFPQNFKVLVDSWNMKSNIWLREYTYKRVTPKGKKPGFRSSMLTFATSAFWHGIAGGYYLTFLFGGFITTTGRLCRAGFRPLVLPPPGAPTTTAKRVYDVLGTVASILLTNYATLPFMILNVKDSITAWQRLGWYGHWMIVSALLFFYGGGTSYLKGLQKKNAAEDARRSGSTTPASVAYTVPLDSAARQIEKMAN